MSRKPTRTSTRRVRAQLRKNSQITVPAEVRAALGISEGDELEFTLSESGDVGLRGMTVIPTDQRWFWTEAWQSGEREASEEIARGELVTHDDVDTFFNDLKSAR